MIVRPILPLVFPQRRRTILLLLSAFAFGFGAIASKRSEDGGEKAGMRADVKQICRAYGAGHHRYFARIGFNSVTVSLGQSFFSVRIAFFNAEWHGQSGSAGICGMARATICLAMSAL